MKPRFSCIVLALCLAACSHPRSPSADTDSRAALLSPIKGIKGASSPNAPETGHRKHGHLTMGSGFGGGYGSGIPAGSSTGASGPYMGAGAGGF